MDIKHEEKFTNEVFFNCIILTNTFILFPNISTPHVNMLLIFSLILILNNYNLKWRQLFT